MPKGLTARQQIDFKKANPNLKIVEMKNENSARARRKKELAEFNEKARQINERIRTGETKVVNKDGNNKDST